ncbi:MAG: DNA cytosine methyltransferase [Sulfuriferula sp.]
MKSVNLQKLKAIDLFCGAGGLTLGLQQAGFEVIGAVEILPVAADTYKENHPDVDLQRSDIRAISPENLMKKWGLKKGELDLIAGCPPCQGFSSIRTRNKASSVEDVRNDLVFEYLRFVEAFLPKTVMMENVPALARDQRIEDVVVRLAELGYKVDNSTVQVQDAANFGVPQRRRRMILMASRLGMIPETPKVIEKVTVRKAFEPLDEASRSKDLLHNLSSKRTARIQNLIAAIPKDGGSRSSLPQSMWLECHKRYPQGFKDVYGRIAWDDVSPTMTGGCNNPSKGRFLHPEENRVISLREAALLQTFPKNYYFPTDQSRDKVALMIGNALPPEFIRHHASSIFNHLSE